MNLILLVLFSLMFLHCDSSDATDNDGYYNAHYSTPAIISSSSDLPAFSQAITKDSELKTMFENQISNQQVMVQGKIQKILTDDAQGDRHQRFIIVLSNNQTLLVAHNIDLAPRIPGLRINDTMFVYGEYEWNEQGGVLHWTHHDPDHEHTDGFIWYQGTYYQ